MLWDVAIAGSGPAAAAAANVLARAGLQVLLIDRVDPTYHKVGEVLPGAALRLLRSLHLPFPEVAAGHTRIVGGLSAWESPALVSSDTLRSPDGPSWRLDRAHFDEQLRQTALASGATLHTALVRRVQRCSGAWNLQLDQGDTASARWLIDATGRRSAISRALGAKRLLESSLVALYALSKAAARGPVLQRTVLEAVPEGWWYAAYLPSGRAVAGLHVTPGLAARFAKRDQWHHALAQTRHIRSLFPELRDPAFLRPQQAGGARLDRFSGEGWLACGDAALSFDPLSSQGLLTALYSGKIAADAVLNSSSGYLQHLAYEQPLLQVWNAYKLRASQFYKIATYRWESSQTAITCPEQTTNGSDRF